MKAFVRLHQDLDSCPFHRDKSARLAEYFSGASDEDASWALFLLLGGQLKRAVPSALLKSWLLEETQLPAWLFEQCKEQVGDLAETIALLAELGKADFDEGSSSEGSLCYWIENELQPLQEKTPELQRASLLDWWKRLPLGEISLIHHLLGGRYSPPATRRLIEEALARVTGLPRELISLRLSRIPLEALASPHAYRQLLAAQEELAEQLNLHDSSPVQEVASRPAESLDLISPLTQWIEVESCPPEFANAPKDWLVEPAFAGLAALLERSRGEVSIWVESQNLDGRKGGLECVSGRFPELVQAAACLPDETIIEGEIRPHPAAARRLVRRPREVRLTPRLLRTEPVHFLAQDCQRIAAEDMRSRDLIERLKRLKLLLPAQSSYLKTEETLNIASAAEIQDIFLQCRERGTMGLRLRHPRDGRALFWKCPPLTLDAVLIHVETGQNGLQSCSFALWEDQELVPLARTTPEGLDPALAAELETWVRENIRERFGPVRSVDPIQVFEIAFDELEESPRHRSGFMLRAPRIIRWKKEARAEDAATLKALQQLKPST